MWQGFGRRRADTPTGHGGGELGQGAALARLTPAIEQDRRLAVAGGELKAARGRLVGRLHLGHDASERAVAETILGHRQDVGVLRPLGIEYPIRPKPDLLQPWRVEIEPREHPQHGEAGLRCETRRDTGHEQGCRGIVAQRG